MPSWKKVIISGSDAALNSLNVTTALTASNLNYPSTDGTSGQVITTDGAGNLFFADGGGGLGSTTKLNQTVAATTWSFNHNLGEKFPVVNVYDSNDDIIIPQKIDAVDSNNMLIYFSSARTGVAAAVVGGVAISASYALTASYLEGGADLFPYTGSAQITGSLTVTGSGTFSGYLVASGNLGVNTYNPTVPLDVHGYTNSGMVVQIDNTQDTKDTRILMLQSGSSQWAFGNEYDSANNNFSIWDGENFPIYNKLFTLRKDGGVTATSFTGSLQGTASYATEAANGGVTQIIAGTNISLSPTSGIGTVVINAVAAGQGSNTTASFSNSTTWTFNHNLNSQYVVVQTVDSNNSQIIPQSITLADANTATITFPSNETGVAIATLGGIGTTAATASYASTAATASYVNTLNQNVLVTGSMTIGNTTAGISENTLTLGARDTTNEGGQLGLNAPGGTYTSASFLDNWQNKFRILKGTNTGGSTSAPLQLDLNTGDLTVGGAVTASAYSGLPNTWLNALRTTNQTIGSGTWANRDIIFNDYSSIGFTYNPSTGVATLKAGKVYRITSRLAWSAAGGYILQFRLYNQTTSAFVGPTAECMQPSSATYNSSDGTLEYIWAVGASDTDITVRTTSATNALTGEYIRGDLNTQLIIQQIA